MIVQGMGFVNYRNLKSGIDELIVFNTNNIDTFVIVETKWSEDIPDRKETLFKVSFKKEIDASADAEKEMTDEIYIYRNMHFVDFWRDVLPLLLT